MRQLVAVRLYLLPLAMLFGRLFLALFHKDRGDGRLAPPPLLFHLIGAPAVVALIIAAIALGLPKVFDLMLPALINGLGNFLAPLRVGVSAVALRRFDNTPFWLLAIIDLHDRLGGHLTTGPHVLHAIVMFLFVGG